MASVVIAGDTSGTVTLAAPATAGTTTLTLPTTNGTLITTGSSGQSIPKAALPTGSVLQVVSTAKTDTFSTTSTTYTDITGLSVSITPISSSSKILIMYQLLGTADPANAGMCMRLVRNSTAIFVGDAAGSRPQATNGINSSLNNFCVINMADSFLDSPSSSSSTTYKIQMFNSAGTTSYVNRSQTDRDNALYDGRGASSITVMEIAA